MKDRGILDFSIGDAIIKVDTSDFKNVDFEKIKDWVVQQINDIKKDV